jgi:hypothetical protein
MLQGFENFEMYLLKKAVYLFPMKFCPNNPIPDAQVFCCLKYFRHLLRLSWPGRNKGLGNLRLAGLPQYHLQRFNLLQVAVGRPLGVSVSHNRIGSISI